jgi:hypothetical protein
MNERINEGEMNDVPCVWAIKGKLLGKGASAATKSDAALTLSDKGGSQT